MMVGFFMICKDLHFGMDVDREVLLRLMEISKKRVFFCC